MFNIFANFMARKRMIEEEFLGYKAFQYCDTVACGHYNEVGARNLITHSIGQGQVRCGSCKGKPFSVRKGTMFFHLRTPMERIVTCLLSLTSGPIVVLCNMCIVANEIWRMRRLL